MSISLEKAVPGSSIQKSIQEKGPYASSKVKEISFNGEKGQAMDFWAAGLHEKSCQIALRKLSLYENYKQYLGFIEESLYIEDAQLVMARIATPIFPIKVDLRFKIPRIEKVGVYPFEFKEGFLKDLRGEVHVSEEKGRCFIFVKADWAGKHTGFPCSLLEIFSAGVVQMGMERLFKISTY